MNLCAQGKLRMKAMQKVHHHAPIIGHHGKKTMRVTLSKTIIGPK